jgi:hypothetical protein
MTLRRLESGESEENSGIYDIPTRSNPWNLEVNFNTRKWIEFQSTLNSAEFFY